MFDFLYIYIYIREKVEASNKREKKQLEYVFFLMKKKKINELFKSW